MCEAPFQATSSCAKHEATRATLSRWIPQRLLSKIAQSAYLTGFYALAWADWLACDNPYAQGDRAAIAADALGYLNTIAITLRKL